MRASVGRITLARGCKGVNESICSRNSWRVCLLKALNKTALTCTNHDMATLIEQDTSVTSHAIVVLLDAVSWSFALF